MKIFGTVYWPVFCSRYRCIAAPSSLSSSLHNKCRQNPRGTDDGATIMNSTTHWRTLTGTPGNSDWRRFPARRQNPQYDLENMAIAFSAMAAWLNGVRQRSLARHGRLFQRTSAASLADACLWACRVGYEDEAGGGDSDGGADVELPIAVNGVVDGFRVGRPGPDVAIA